MATKAITLPSGATLEVTVSPFSISKALYMAIAAEAKDLKLDPKAEVDVNLYKDLLCMALGSPKIESALYECMKRCTYKGLKITLDTFEPVDARDDYLTVCFEVARENILPFTKSLSAQFAGIFQSLKKLPA